MPNGHLPPAPRIDHREPNSLVLQWLVNATSLLYAGMGEIKEDLGALSVWKNGIDARHLRDDEAARAEAHRLELRQRWWSGVKVRVELAAALVGAGVLLGGAVATVIQRL